MICDSKLVRPTSGQMVQVALRAVVLTSLIGDSLDHVWAICEALEGWSLLLQVIVFIFMDAMELEAPNVHKVPVALGVEDGTIVCTHVQEDACKVGDTEYQVYRGEKNRCS